MLLKLTPGDDLPLRLGRKVVVPKTQAEIDAAFIAKFGDPIDTNVAWVVPTEDIGLKNGEIDPRIKQSDVRGAEHSGVLPRYSTWDCQCEQCKPLLGCIDELAASLQARLDRGALAIGFDAGEADSTAVTRYLYGDFKPTEPMKPLTATGLQMLIEASRTRTSEMLRTAVMRDRALDSAPPMVFIPYSAGDPGAPLDSAPPWAIPIRRTPDAACEVLKTIDVPGCACPTCEQLRADAENPF